MLPGRMATYLTNAVIIPRLAYSLQSLPISKTFLEELDTKIRKFNKRKWSLSKNTPNSILYDKSHGIKLVSISNYMFRQNVTNTIVCLNRNTIESKVLMHTIALESIKKKIPRLLITHPLQIKRPQTYIQSLSATLYNNNMRIHDNSETDPIFKHISTQDYNKIGKELLKRNLKYEDFISHTKPGYTKSYSEFSEPSRRKSIKELGMKEFFKIVIKTIAESSYEIGEYTKHKLKKLTQPITVPKRIHNSPTYEYEIWTDGSHFQDTNELGAAALIINLTNNKKTEKKYKPPPGNEQSTKAELWAILNAIIDVYRTAHTITIKTDSQNSIENIRFLKNQPDHFSRLFMKPNNAPIINQIIKIIKDNQIIIYEQKVDAHTGIAENELVDKLAKEAAKDKNLEPLDILGTDRFYLYHQNQLVNQYPSFAIKQLDQNFHHQINLKRLNNIYEHLIDDIDFEKTIKITNTGMLTSNHLDATSTKEMKFRIQNLYKSTITKSKLNEWFPEIYTNFCHKCFETENDPQHYLTCDSTIKQLPELFQEFKDKLNDHNRQKQWKNLPKLETQEFLEKLDLHPQNIMNESWSKGLINKQSINHFKRLFPKFKTAEITDLLYFITDAWLSTIYENFTIERSYIINYERKTWLTCHNLTRPPNTLKRNNNQITFQQTKRKRLF